MKPSRQSAVRQAKYSGKNTVSMGIDLAAFNAMVGELEQDVQAAVRPAAQAGAQVIYEAVLANVQKIRAVTGNLRSSIYQVFSTTNSREAGGGYAKATYHVSWNAKKASHAHLIEYGHLQRYEYYKDEKGHVRPRVQPGMDGKRKPGRKATQAQKDAYYVPRKGGPLQVPARPFIRPALSKQDDAVAAVRTKFFDVLGAK